MEKLHRNILWLFAGILLVSFLGFYKTYFGLFPQFAGTVMVVHFHVATILIWFGLLFIQPILIWRRNYALHKALGKFSYFLALLIVIGFGLVMNYGQLRHKDVGLVGATLFDGLMFVLFYSLGLFYRKKTAYHSRFMILSALPFINPGLGRFIGPEISLPVELLCIIALLVLERFHQKIYKPYWIGLGAFFGMLGVIIYLSVINPQILENAWQLIWG